MTHSHPPHLLHSRIISNLTLLHDFLAISSTYISNHKAEIFGLHLLLHVSAPPKNDKFPFSFTSFNNLPTKHEWKGFFLIKKKVLKEKNWLGKRFPIRETHCAMVYTAMWTNDRVPIRNWCAGLFLPLFAPRPNVFWCILVTRWHSHLPRSDLTAFGIGSPWGKRGGRTAIIHAICLKVFAFLQTKSKSGGAAAALLNCVTSSLRHSQSKTSSSSSIYGKGAQKSEQVWAFTIHYTGRRGLQRWKKYCFFKEWPLLVEWC